jgi:hypothetical protein
MDAATHAYLACVLYRDLATRPVAAHFLESHEHGRPEDTCEQHEMDLNNNEIGRRLAREEGDCSDLVFAQLNADRLHVNRPFPEGMCSWTGNGL